MSTTRLVWPAFKGRDYGWAESWKYSNAYISVCGQMQDYSWSDMSWTKLKCVCWFMWEDACTFTCLKQRASILICFNFTGKYKSALNLFLLHLGTIASWVTASWRWALKRYLTEQMRQIYSTEFFSCKTSQSINIDVVFYLPWNYHLEMITMYQMQGYLV